MLPTVIVMLNSPDFGYVAELARDSRDQNMKEKIEDLSERLRDTVAR